MRRLVSTMRGLVVVAAMAGLVVGCGGAVAPESDDPDSLDLGLPGVEEVPTGDFTPDAEPELEIRNAWARPAPAGGNTAVYLEIENRRSDDAITGVSSEAAESVSLHQSLMEGDMARMEHVATIPLPSGEVVRLEPGGYHVMMLGVTDDLEVGDTVPLILELQGYGNFALSAEVRESDLR